MSTLFCDADKLERKLNRPIGSLDVLATLELKGSQIVLVEDMARLVRLTRVDLSGNLIATREQLQGLLCAPALVSLDLRGCPVTLTDNYRRWVIARAPASLATLDGKEVSALERRYAYKLFPELRPAEAPASQSASGSAPRGPAATDDLFAEALVTPTVSSSAGAAVGGAELFESVVASSPSKGASGFGRFFPAPTAAPVTMAVGAPGAAAPTLLMPAPEVDPPAPVTTFDLELSGSSFDPLLDNSVIKRQDQDVLASHVVVRRPERPAVAPQAPPAPAPPPVLEPVVGQVPAPAPLPAGPRKDAVLDNDVLSGRSFLEQHTSMTAASQLAPKKRVVVAASSPAADIGSMFFENSKAAPPSPVSRRARSAADARGASALFEEIHSSPLVLDDGMQQQLFGGAKKVEPQQQHKVQTYSPTTASEEGETVSYGVEQVMAYVLLGFRPSSSNAASGLFEFTVQSRDATPDAFHVRVSSPGGVSVHAGRVPGPEAWAVDCRLTLTDAVMQDILNGSSDPSSALLNGSLQVEGQLPKLLLFKEVFHFALARFNTFRTRWNASVVDEEKELRERGRAKLLDPDMSDALQFLLFAWKGTFPPSWGVKQVAYVLIAQLPDNVYYKGYRSDVVITPPKVLLRMTGDSLEFVSAADADANSGGSVMCEIWGKRSVLVQLFTGRLTLWQALSMLAARPDESSADRGRYVYAHAPWRDLDNEPAMWLSERRHELLAANKQAPFLFVRNMSHFDGVNDFEEILRCFDLHLLAYDRFTEAQRQKAQQERETEAAAEAAAAAQALRAPMDGLSTATMATPLANVARTRASSPLEWVEKLKEVKADLSKRILASSPTHASNPLDDDHVANPFFAPRTGATAAAASAGAASSSATAASGGGELRALPKRTFSEYEV